MRVSEKSLELNVGAELLALIRGPWGMPKSYLRGLTQREEKQEGVDFFAHLGAGARMIAFQFKAPHAASTGGPYRYTLVREQHHLLFGLAQLAPDSVFYVFPFYATPAELQRDVPNLARNTWLLRIAPMDTSTVFGAQATRTVRCAPGIASVNPDYRLEVLEKVAGDVVRGIPVEDFTQWYLQFRAATVTQRRHRSPWVARGLRVAVIHRDTIGTV